MSKNLWKDFPQIQKMKQKGCVYLDSAATTLKPQRVVDRLTSFYSEEVSNIHRGSHSIAQNLTKSFEETRELVCNFLSAEYAEEIIFTKSTTEALNLVAECLCRFGQVVQGDRVVLTGVEHHSNLIPWQELCRKVGADLEFIPLTKNFILDVEAGEAIFKKGNVKIFSVAHTSNVLGLINPVKKLIQSARQFNPKVVCVVDAAQAMTSSKVDVQDLDCDFLAFSGHKIFSPTGAAVLYGKKNWLQQLPPYEFGGGMVDDVFETKSIFLPSPHRFEAGTPCVGEVLALAEALRYFRSLDFDSVKKHNQNLLDLAKEVTSHLSGLKTFFNSRASYSSIFSFKIEGVHPADVSGLLDEQGICIRSGKNCSFPLVRFLKTPQGLCRASFSIYNTEDDVLSFSRALEKSISILTN